jgi:hypothetical protein
LRTLGLLLLPGLFVTLRRLLPGLFATLRRLLPGLLATLRRLLPGLLATLRRLLPGLFAALRRLLAGLFATLRRLLTGLLATLRRLLPGLLWARLLLPGLLRTLRLLLLRLFLGSLLRSGGGLRAALFLRLFLLLLRPRLRLRRLGLRLLWLCGPRRRLLWFALLLFRRLGLFWFGVSPLGVGRDNRPECQEQGAGKGSSNVLHRNHLRRCRYRTCTRTARGRGPRLAGMRGGMPCASAEFAMRGAHFAALRGVTGLQPHLKGRHGGWRRNGAASATAKAREV